ncbi:hypothetical protein EST38_g2316 [Candolleomyces aberdarensis]|uniref:Nucleoside phosphorylase domain-containing protein n=1 Tax=Candolleomyces aberdarensis TaxID=2316362 RepID=A0A4Q2DT82_9AGAR|nr:hypothetical protein EST38_g2316 [Candolleomyces aberdarensis]
MGSPNMDFFVREVRECISGDMLIIRLGSCGALVDVAVGSVVLPSSSIGITRNYDFDFVSPGNSSEPAYRFSKPVLADPMLHAEGSPLAARDTVIRAAAVHLVFASRTSQDFITPQEVSDLEDWAGLGVLTALAAVEIPEDRLHMEKGSVWEVKGTV